MPGARATAHVAARFPGPAPDNRLRVTLHLHPELARRSRIAIDPLCGVGRYRSQLGTRTSSGASTARPGGERRSWERRLIGHRDDDSPPRIGGRTARAPSASARVAVARRAHRCRCLERTTLCCRDNAPEQVDFATASDMALVGPAPSGTQDPLDDCVEALVLDPQDRGGRVAEVARRLPHPVACHRDLRLEAAELPPSGLAQRALHRPRLPAGPGQGLTPVVIGGAARTGRHDPQNLKRVWRHASGFGAPGPDRH